MPVQILTGSGADGAFVTEIKVIEEQINNTEGLLNKIVDDVVMPALRRNWDNCHFKTHANEMKGRQAVGVRGAPGNVVNVTGNIATVSYTDSGDTRYISALIDGRKAVKPINAKSLLFNKQYGVGMLYRKSARATVGKPLYYLMPLDEEKISAVVDEWILGEKS